MTAGWLDHALALTLAVLFPIHAGTFGFRRLAQAPPEEVPRVRRTLYTQAMALQWGLAAAAVALWVSKGRPFGTLGLAAPGTLAFAGFATLAVAPMTVRSTTPAFGPPPRP